MNSAELQARYERLYPEGRALFTDNEKFTVRLWDGMDGCWVDIETNVAKDRALAVWAESTSNGTKATSFNDIDYYCIFPADSHMVFSGDNEMFRGNGETHS